MTSNALSDFYTMREAAEVAGVSHVTIWRWIRTGKLTPVRVDGKSLIPQKQIGAMSKYQRSRSYMTATITLNELARERYALILEREAEDKKRAEQARTQRMINDAAELCERFTGMFPEIPKARILVKGAVDDDRAWIEVGEYAFALVMKQLMVLLSQCPGCGVEVGYIIRNADEFALVVHRRELQASFDLEDLEPHKCAPKSDDA